MAAPEVSAWGGFVVCLPACPGLLPAPGAGPCCWVTLLRLSPAQGSSVTLMAQHLRDTHGWAQRGSRHLGGAGIPDGRTRLVSSHLPAEEPLPSIPLVQGGMKEKEAEERV